MKNCPKGLVAGCTDGVFAVAESGYEAFWSRGRGGLAEENEGEGALVTRGGLAEKNEGEGALVTNGGCIAAINGQQPPVSTI